jgi:glycosyltransferase involved in cell wall biosynthesis
VNVCMFVKNSFEYDARVTKEARSLIGAGHRVTVVAIQVPGITAEREQRPDGIAVVRVPRLQFGLGALQRRQRRFVTSVEERHARLTGDAVDEERIRRNATLMQASTATPGDAAPVDSAGGKTDRPDGHAPKGAARWARASTALLRAAASAVRLGVAAARAVLIWPARAVKTWSLNRRFIRAGLATGADVWHCHDLNTLYAGSVCKRRRPGTRLVYDSHELATERSRMSALRRRWARCNERRGLPFADEVVLTTATRAAHVARLYGIPMPTVLRNVPERIGIEEGWDLRELLGIEPVDRILLYQGSIQEYRGIEETIEALDHLEHCVFVVVGYGHHRPALEQMVHRRGLDDRVRFFGPIPNDRLLWYTASADVGMCVIRGTSLSYRWSMPNKLFEYMMAGIPVVASDYEEMGRVVREEGVGEVCDPGDPADIARAVRIVLDGPDGGTAYRNAARRAVERYNWEVEQQVLLDLYRRLEAR